MSSESPASVLYSSDGYELAVISGSAIPSNTRGLLVEGSDGTNSRFMLVDSSGRPVVVGAGVAGTPAGGVLSIQGVAGGTAVPVSGTVTTLNASVGTDGAAALSSDTQVGGKVTTAAPTYTTGNLNALSLTTLGGLRIDGVYAAGTANATAANVSISGGYVTTAAPTYTTGQSNPLSLTTAGLLRVDGTSGVFNDQSVGSTAATTPSFASLAGGAVTTAAPTYTTGQMDPLSLTTTGLLRIDGVYPLAATTPTSDGVFIAAAVTTSAPTYTTGQLNGLSLDTSGNLRVTGNFTSKSSTGTITSVAGSVTTVTLLASNAGRISATIYNESTSKLYIALSATSSLTAYTIPLFPGSYWELPVSYTGAISGIWATAVGNARITELT